MALKACVDANAPAERLGALNAGLKGRRLEEKGLNNLWDCRRALVADTRLCAVRAGRGASRDSL